MSIAEIGFFRAVLVQQWRGVRCRAILLAPDTQKKKKKRTNLGSKLYNVRERKM